MNRNINEYLQLKNRTLRTLPGRLLLGSAGSRLFADYLEPAAGFCGRIDFIHKMNLPGLFGVTCQAAPVMEPAQSVWRPGYLTFSCENSRVSLSEEKFITREDCAVSCQRWSNRTDAVLRLEFQIPGDWATQEQEGCICLERHCENHGLTLVGAVCSDNGIHLQKSLEIPAHGTVEFRIVAAMGERGSESPGDCARRAAQYLRENPTAGACVEKQKADEEAWFADVPSFESDDPLLDRTWWYRWFLLRHNWAEPRCGNMQHGVFYEGRSHKVIKTPYAPVGHEFTQLIPLSTPLHLMDCRWKKGDRECREAVLSLVDSADEAGNFRTMMVDRYGAVYGNFAGWALYQLWLVHGDNGFVEQVLPAFSKNVRAILDAGRNERGKLPVCYDHRRTGKEYQPSFWYFNHYPDHAKDNSTFTFLKRVDLAVYLYLNALGVGKLCDGVGKDGGGEFYRLAEDLKAEILEKMWDPETGFFYDLHCQTEEKALVKNVVGIYPLWAEITDGSHLRLLDYYFSEKGFGTGSGFASVAADCPVFAPQGGWKGEFFKGRNGCVWDGPSWPYTTGIALDAIAMQSKRHGHRYDEMFARYLREYTLEHYKEKNPEMPYLVEHYDSVTGEALSDEVDYLHSFYIDLIVRHVAGISPTEDGMEIDPVDVGLNRFVLRDLYLRGRKIEVSYERGSHYTVTVDGKQVFCRKEPQRTVIRFA